MLKSGPWYVHCFTSALSLYLESSFLLHAARSEIIDHHGNHDKDSAVNEHNNILMMTMMISVMMMMIVVMNVTLFL